MSDYSSNSDQNTLINREESTRQRRAFQISLVTGIMTVLIALAIVLILTIRPGVIGNPRSLIAVIFLCLASFVSAYLARIGKYQIGIGILISSVLIISMSFPFIASDMGLQIGLLTLMVISGIASVTLRGRYATYAIGGAVILALYNVLMDFFGPELAAPGKPTVITVVTICMFLVYLYIILRQFRHYSLRSKLVLSFILVTLIPLTIMATVSTIRLTGNLTVDSQKGLTSTAQQTAKSLDAFLEKSLDDVYTEAQLSDFRDFLALSPELRQTSTERSQALGTLRLFQRRRSSLVRSYALLDTDGINVLDTDSQRIGLRESNREYFTYPVETLLNYVSPLLFLDAGPALVFSSPVWSEEGQILGVLRIEFNAFVLQEELMSVANQFREEELYAVVVDQDYFTRLAHSRDYGAVYRTYAAFDDNLIAQLQGEDRLPNGAPEDLRTNQQDMVDWLKNWRSEPFSSPSAYALKGSAALSTVAEMQKAPWLVITRQPLDVAMREVDMQFKFSILFSIFMVLIMAGVAVMVTQMIAAPIVNLTHIAEQVGHGDLSVRAPVQTEDEVGELAVTFNQMTDELQSTLENLEKRVADRTRAIELSADVSRRLSTVLDPVQLVTEVVSQLQKVFNYYHVQIYLLDDRREYLDMVGGTGEAGKTMVEQGHRLKLGQGLVGRACETGTAIVVKDTHNDPQWLPNPLLPETKSEIAVPILLGDEVLGALDVQDDVVEGLVQQDVDLLTSIANQVAIALRNSRQYMKAQQQAVRAARVNEIIEQIQNTYSIENALQVAVRELGRELAIPRITVKLKTVNDPRNEHEQ